MVEFSTSKISEEALWHFVRGFMEDLRWPGSSEANRVFKKRRTRPNESSKRDVQSTEVEPVDYGTPAIQVDTLLGVTSQFPISNISGRHVARRDVSFLKSNSSCRHVAGRDVTTDT